MLALQIQLEVLTPLFLGGANGAAEVRPASFRGALRHWYRTIDSDFHKHEAHFFGGVAKKQGQSPFLLRVSGDNRFIPMQWPDAEALKIFDVGTGIETKNGVKYLGYVFDLPGNEHRNAIPPGVKLHATCTIPRPDRLTQNGWQALLSAWWLLGHVGSLGTRARRGFGSLALCDWQLTGLVPPGWQRDFDALPLLVKEKDVEAWARGARQTRSTMGDWFSTDFSECLPPHFGPKSRAVLLRNGHAFRGSLPWGRPLQDAGLRLQRFRSAHEPDRGRARDHVRWLNNPQSGEPLSDSAPERAAFGLPLTFRFINIDKRSPREKQFELQPAGSDERGRKRQRFPSPLWIRVVRVADAHHALLTRLDGALPGAADGIQAEPGAGGQPLVAHDGQILDDFLAQAQFSGVPIDLGGKK